MFRKKEFTKYLYVNAVRIKKEPKFIKKSPLDWEFDSCEKIMSGKHTQAYKVLIQGRYWIIKEGLESFPLIKLLNYFDIRVPWIFLSPPLSFVDIDVLPHMSSILKSFAQYMELARYLGYFSDKDTLERLKISKKHQKKLRDRAGKQIKKSGEFGQYLYKVLGNDKDLYNVLKQVWKRKESRYTNFLPDEYLIISHASNNEKKQTYYIVQEYIKGEILGNVNEELLNEELLCKLIILLSLIIYMTFNNSLLLDTRPENHLSGITEWFRKTGNIIINIRDNTVNVVDTRTVWHPNKAPLQRTMIIPSLIENSVFNALKHYLKIYKGIR